MNRVVDPTHSCPSLMMNRPPVNIVDAPALEPSARGYRANGPGGRSSERLPAGSTVIVVGPPATQMGGMASVVQAILTLELGECYHTYALPCTFSSRRGETVPRRLRRHAGQLRLLRGVIRETGAAIVHLHTCSGFTFFRSAVDMMAAQRLGARVILHVHGAAFDRFFAEAGFLKRRLIASCLSRADCVIALSQRWRRKLRRMAPGARIAVVENAVEIPRLQRLEPVERDEKGCRFLLMARMDTWKGVDDLLTACVRLRDCTSAFELTLAGPAGTAGDADELQRKIARWKLNSCVTYAGPAGDRDKARLLRSADVYVQPSHHEGMPISLLEALAHGLPVIASAVGAVPEVITHGRQGLLVPAQRPDLLADAMSKLAGDAGQRARMSAAARRTAEQRFSLDRFRNDLVRVYDAVRAGFYDPAV